MKKYEFKAMLKAAVTGDHDSLECVLRLYEPLINKHSIINGVLDEDLRQYIMIHIALNIGKFPV